MIFDVERSNKVELKFYETEVLLKFSEKINLALKRDNFSWI